MNRRRRRWVGRQSVDPGGGGPALVGPGEGGPALDDCDAGMRTRGPRSPSCRSSSPVATRNLGTGG